MLALMTVAAVVAVLTVTIVIGVAAAIVLGKARQRHAFRAHILAAKRQQPRTEIDGSSAGRIVFVRGKLRLGDEGRSVVVGGRELALVGAFTIMAGSDREDAADGPEHAVLTNGKLVQRQGESLISLGDDDDVVVRAICIRSHQRARGYRAAPTEKLSLGTPRRRSTIGWADAPPVIPKMTRRFSTADLTKLDLFFGFIVFGAALTGAIAGASALEWTIGPPRYVKPNCAGRICFVHGRCALMGNICAPKDDDDCRPSTACRDEGHCAIVGEGTAAFCRPTERSHCEQSAYCKHYDRCVLTNDSCRVTRSRGKSP